MRWFRLYDCVLDDPKVQRLPGDLFKAWINLMCLANKGEPRGVLPSAEEIAFRLRVSDEEGARIVAELEARNLLEYNDDGELQPHNWEIRQPVSDNVTPRVYKSRAAKRPVTSNAECNVTSNVTVTAQEEKRGEEKKKRKDSFAHAADAAPSAPPSGTKESTINQQMWAVLRDELGHEPHPSNKSERGKWNGAIKSLLNVGETPDTLADLIKRYLDRWPEIDCTPSALVTHHSLIRSAPPTKPNRNGHAAPTAPEPVYLTDEQRAEQIRKEMEWAEKNTIPPSYLLMPTNGSSARPPSAIPTRLPRSSSG